MLVPSFIFSLLAATALWFSGRRNPARDPRITVTILAVLLILPLFNLAPKFAIAVAASASGSETASAPPSSWHLPALWLSGCLFFTLRGLRDVIALRKWRHDSYEASLSPLPREITSKVGLRIHPALKSPVVAGLFKPTIYLPESSREWSSETLRMALLHELGHVQRRDLWMALLAQVVCILHWFNPAVWWMRRVFLTQCEYACDAHLLKRGADPKSYALALCDVAQAASTPALSLAMAGHALLRDRIKFLSDSRRRGSFMLPAIVLITAGSAIAMTMVRLVPSTGHAHPASPPSNETELRFTADPFPSD